MSKRMDIDAFQKALNNDGKISAEEREQLIAQAIPDRLLEALEDGVLDAKEIAELKAMGFSDQVLEALKDGHLDDDEKVLIKIVLAEDMRQMRQKQLQEAFKKFDVLFKK